MFEKGKQKTGGRKPGVVNKTTKISSDLITEFLTGHFPELDERMARLTDRDWCEVFCKLLKHSIPQYQAIQFKDENGSTDKFLEFLISLRKGE